MNKIQEDIINREIILLDKEDIRKITGWGKNTVDRIFSKDEYFPTITIGKKQIVLLEAFKEYLKVRR